MDVPGCDVRLRATRWPGAGVPVLLLHGLASSRRFWDLVVPGLAGHPVVALDQRGHGDSERPDGPYDGATVVADALTALDALGLSRAVVVGHSWGASTALRLAADVPSGCWRSSRSTAGSGAPVSWRRPGSRPRERLTPPRWALPPDELRAPLRRRPLGAWWSEEVEAALLPLFTVGRRPGPRATAFEAHMAIVDSLLDSDPATLLPRITCPAWLALRTGRREAWTRARAPL